MAALTRDQVKNVVIQSLQQIANLPDDVEAASLSNMVATQQEVFLSSLKSNLNVLPYYTDDGTTSGDAYYDVDLMPDTINQWPTVGDCINWINKNQKVVYR